MGEPENGGEGGGEGGGFMNEHTAESLENANGWRGRVSQGLDLLGGAAMFGPAKAAWNGIQAFTGGGSSFSTLANSFANGSHAVEEGSSFLGGAGSAFGGKLLPGIGTALSVGGFALDGLNLANTVKQEGFANAYHDQKAYNSAGGMALNAAHAVLPWLGPYGEAANLALTGGELAADGAGKASKWAFGKNAEFNANSLAGGLIRGTFGDQSLGDGARRGIEGVLGNNTASHVIGTGAQILTNSAMLPANLAMTAGRGVFNAGKTVVNSIANGEGAVGGALHDAGLWAGHTASNIGHGIGNAASSAWNWGSNAASNVGHGLSSAASSAASTVGSGLSSAGHAASSAIHAVTSW